MQRVVYGVSANPTAFQFVMDDTAAVVNNADVSPTSSVWDLFRNDYWYEPRCTCLCLTAWPMVLLLYFPRGDPLSSHRSHKSYRPLTVISFRLNNLRGQLQPWAFHATNVILHGGASALVTIMAAIVVQLTLVEAVRASSIGRADVAHQVGELVFRPAPGYCSQPTLCMSKPWPMSWGAQSCWRVSVSLSPCFRMSKVRALES